MTKKITAVLAVLFLMLSMIPVTVSAQATVTFSVGTLSHDGVLRAGEEITLPVYVRSTEPFCMLELEVHFDPEKWEVTDYTQEDFLAKNFSAFHDVNIAPTDILTGEPIEGCVVIGAMSLNDTSAETDVLLSVLTLRALCDITQDEPFTVKAIKAAKAPTKALPCEGVNGGIDIKRGPLDIGDINADGTVSLPDATLLFYAVNGLAELSEEQQAAADMNGDGTVSLDDATSLFYRVNGLV